MASFSSTSVVTRTCTVRATRTASMRCPIHPSVYSTNASSKGSCGSGVNSWSFGMPGFRSRVPPHGQELVSVEEEPLALDTVDLVQRDVRAIGGTGAIRVELRDRDAVTADRF